MRTTILLSVAHAGSAHPRRVRAVLVLAALCLAPLTAWAQTAPSLTVPADITVESSAQGGQPVAIGQAVASHPSLTVLISNDAPAIFGLGVTVVTWTATDASGNATSASQNIIVEDTTAPTLVVPADVTVESSSQGGQPVAIGQASASDVSDPAPAISNDAPAIFFFGVTAVTWTATDASGNATSASQNIIVEDTTAPTLVVPADVTVESSSQGGQPVAIGQASASDVSDPVFAILISNDAPAIFFFGVTAVTWTATDASGNATSASQNIIVEDTTAPTLVVPADVTVESSSQGGQPVAIGQASASDVSDPVFAILISNDAPAIFFFGVTAVTWTATDASGNATSASQNIIVEDTTAPTLVVPADVTVESSSQGGQPVAIGQASASDVSDPAPAISNDAPAIFFFGVTAVTWTATDASGNATSASQNIIVEDTTAPTLVVPADVTVESSSQGGQPVAIGQASASDVSDPAPAISNDAPAIFFFGVTAVTWTATDASGNATSASQNIIVEDTTAPTLVVPADVTVESSSQGGQPVAIGQASASDVSDPAPAISNDAPAIFFFGVTAVTWTATDASGNATSASQNIIVEDTTAPTLVVPADVTVESSSQGGQPVAIGQASASDVSDPVFAILISNDAPAIFFFGVTAVTWTATDASGNATSASQNIIVEDTTAPRLPSLAPIALVGLGLALFVTGTRLFRRGQ